MFGKWWKKRDEPSQSYVRREPKEILAFYKPYARFFTQTPEDTARLVAAIAAKTELGRNQDEFPADAATIRAASHAFCDAVRDCFQFELTAENSDATQMDRLADHLIDPALRPFFANGKLRNDLSDSQSESYFKVREAVSVPNEPLLYYAMGAFQCEWLARHRQATLCLYAPIRSIQSFPDMIAAGHTICLHPFSQVTKRLSDPEGDNLEFKNSPGIKRRYIPPFPLIASLADANFAVAQLLPALGREAMETEKAGNRQQAFPLYAKAIADNPKHVQLLSMGASCAMAIHEYDMAVNWMEAILAIHPDLPMINHNLAILYGTVPHRQPEAMEMLRRAIQVDPYYARARITLASFLLDAGRRDEAVAQAKWVLQNDQNLKQEAANFLQQAGAS